MSQVFHLFRFDFSNGTDTSHCLPTRVTARSISGSHVPNDTRLSVPRVFFHSLSLSFFFFNHSTDYATCSTKGRFASKEELFEERFKDNLEENGSDPCLSRKQRGGDTKEVVDRERRYNRTERFHVRRLVSVGRGLLDDTKAVVVVVAST